MNNSMINKEDNFLQSSNPSKTNNLIQSRNEGPNEITKQKSQKASFQLIRLNGKKDIEKLIKNMNFETTSEELNLSEEFITGKNMHYKKNKHKLNANNFYTRRKQLIDKIYNEFSSKQMSNIDYKLQIVNLSSNTLQAEEKHISPKNEKQLNYLPKITIPSLQKSIKECISIQRQTQNNNNLNSNYHLFSTDPNIEIHKNLNLITENKTKSNQILNKLGERNLDIAKAIQFYRKKPFYESLTKERNKFNNLKWKLTKLPELDKMKNIFTIKI